MRTSALTVCLAAAFGVFASPAFAMDLKEFKKAYAATPNSWERRALVTQLNPEDKKSLKLITGHILKKMDWYMRDAAIQLLAGVYDPGVIVSLEKQKDPVVVEGVALAFGRSGKSERIPFLIKLLEHKKWKVRRAAGQALALVPDKRAVEPLIDAWDNEERFMVWVHLLESLEKITRQKNMPLFQKKLPASRKFCAREASGFSWKASALSSVMPPTCTDSPGLLEP